MADTLESLEIEVKHKASGAETEIAKVTAQIKAMADAIAKALPNLKEYAAALGKIGSGIKGSANSGGGKKKPPLAGELQDYIQNASRYEIALNKVAEAGIRMDEAFKKGNESGAWKAREAELNGLAQVQKYRPKSPLPLGTQDIIEEASAIDVLEAKLVNLRDAMQDAFAGGDLNKAYELRGQIIKTEESITRLQKAAQKAADAERKAAEATKEVGKAAEKTSKPLNNFISSLKRIAFYRIIRGIIKSITQAFSDGLQKAYLFSSGIEGEGNRFAQALDRMKSSGNQMKAQLGSAFIALLAAVEPILIRLINIVTAVADAVSQLLSAFTGNTYLKANLAAAQFADTMASGAGSAKEWKNQLLGFDEINRLNAPNNGGGGGGSNPLDGFDFADAPISEFWLRTAETIKAIWEDVKLAGEGLIKILTGLFTGDWEAIFSGMADITQVTFGIFDRTLEYAGFMADSFVDFTEARLNDLLSYLEKATGVDLTHLKEQVQKTMLALKEFISKEIKALRLELGGFGEFLRGAFVGDWDLAFKGIKKMCLGAMDEIQAKFEFLMRMFKVQLDGLMYMVQQVAKFFGITLNIGGGGAMQALRNVANGVDGFASGGFPSEGDLFIANERGPELVSTMGGRTAVGNQDMIIEGIRQGVFDAMVAANGGGERDVNVKVFLDSKEIKVGQQRLNRAWGV